MMSGWEDGKSFTFRGVVVVQQLVERDQCARSADTRAAVNQDGTCGEGELNTNSYFDSGTLSFMERLCPVDEVEQKPRVVGNREIRPLLCLHLLHLSFAFVGEGENKCPANKLYPMLRIMFST